MGSNTSMPPWGELYGIYPKGVPLYMKSEHTAPSYPISPAGQLLPQQQDENIHSLSKWVSMRELCFIFLACSMVVVFLKNQDRLEFHVLWNENFNAEHFAYGKSF